MLLLSKIYDDLLDCPHERDDGQWGTKFGGLYSHSIYDKGGVPPLNPQLCRYNTVEQSFSAVMAYRPANVGAILMKNEAAAPASVKHECYSLTSMIYYLKTIYF